MKSMTLSLTVLCIAFNVMVLNGCGDDTPEPQPKSDPSAKEITEIEETTRKLEEAQRKLDAATQKLAEQEKANQSLANKPAQFVPPPDHLEPLDLSFGFGNPDEVAHFWNWTQVWEFTAEQATNKQKPGGAALVSTYKLVGDFQITLKGKLTQSWTNSKRSTFEVCGQAIGLAKWRSVGIDLTVKREGNQLTYTLGKADPVVVELSEDQAGPTDVKLVVYGRFVFIRQFDLVAESATRSVSSDSTP